jgi:Glycosyl transferase family 11
MKCLTAHFCHKNTILNYKKMITVKLHGGLGNQLFQYAFAKALAKHLNTDFEFDDSFYAQNITRTNHLFDFDINYTISESKPPKWPWLLKRLSRGVGLKSYIAEPRFGFTDVSKQIKGDVFLDGYWQSERYFQAIQTEIRRDFSTFRQPISQTALPILAQIKATNSVCVHARRGDYLTNKRYVVLEMDYYRRAIKTLSSQFTNLHFFVFSDDIDWCKVNFEADCNCTFVSDNQRFMLRDEFEMMQNCQHHITANSTLSWWAAWLNKNHVKVVICPQKWFFDAKSTQDLIPQTWIQL